MFMSYNLSAYWQSPASRFTSLGFALNLASYLIPESPEEGDINQSEKSPAVMKKCVAGLVFASVLPTFAKLSLVFHAAYFLKNAFSMEKKNWKNLCTTDVPLIALEFLVLYFSNLIAIALIFSSSNSAQKFLNSFHQKIESLAPPSPDRGVPLSNWTNLFWN